jgi:superfamily II DNA or RNA helicase
MVKLLIDNSYSQVSGLNLQQLTKLRQLLSYQVESSYFSGRPRFTTKYMIDKKGHFPSGLRHRVTDFLRKEKIAHTVITTHRCPIRDFDLIHPGNAYKWQVEALAAAERWGRGIISACTGSGKSRVIALIASRFNVKTLVVVPTLEIKKQLQSGLKGLKNVTVENIDSPALKTPKGYDMLIIDECHHVAANTYQKLNKTAWKGIYYRFFLTATPFRNRQDENLLFEGIAGQVIYRLTYKEAVKQGYIVPVEAYYIDVPRQEIEVDTWAAVYSQLVVHNEARNSLITQLMVQLNAAGKSTLTLVKEIAHGDNLSCDGAFLFANGQDEESREFIQLFNDGKIKRLIGTTGVLGEGVDTKPCEYVIIAGLGKAKGAFMQQVGRAVRKHPGKESAIVIIFRDPSHRFTLKHFREQAKVLKEEYSVIPQKLDL